MNQLSISDWFGLMSFLVATLSLFFNFIQSKKLNKLEGDISKRTVTGLNAGYQALWRVAELCDSVRENKRSNENIQSTIPFVYESIQEISGCVDTGRAVMNSICRDFTGERLHYESPWAAQSNYMEEQYQKELEVIKSAGK